MASPSVKLNLKGKLEKKAVESEFKPSAGAKLYIDLGDADTSVEVDYSDPDSLKLKLDGSIKFKLVDRIDVEAGASAARDVLKNENTFAGRLELTIDKNIAVNIKYKKKPDDTSIGADVAIQF